MNIRNNNIENALQIQTTNDVWNVFVTQMSINENRVVLDIWCPEQPAINARQSIPVVGGDSNFLQQYITDILHKLGITNFVLMPYTPSLL